MPVLAAIHLDWVSRKTRRILYRATGTDQGMVPILRHDGARIGAVIPAEVADLLEEALEGVTFPGTLLGQTDPAMRAKLISLSGRFRGQYQGDRHG